MKQQEKMLRKQDVATLLDVSMGKVDLLMQSGMKYYKFGRNVRFKMDDVQEYLETKTVKNDQP